MRELIAVLAVFMLVGCTANETVTEIKVDMLDAAGDVYGTAVFTEETEGVGIKIDLEGLSPGFHGIHIHEKPVCDPPDFTSAGEHFNPEGDKHGLMHPEGAHAGDLPNIEADSNGKADVELTLPKTTLLEGKNSLLREEGTSLIVHEAQDDGVSQPSGESGKRILCGEITAD